MDNITVPNSSGAVYSLLKSLPDEQRHPILWNCLPDWEVPDMRQFDALEISGCVATSDHDGKVYVTSGQPVEDAEFFSVYGHVPDQGAECLTDCASYEVALGVAKFLSETYNLPVYDHT